MTEKENFYISELCTSRNNCDICRARHEGRNWRKSLRSIYRLASVDFDCPEGKDWIEDRATTNQSDAIKRKPCSNCGKKKDTTAQTSQKTSATANTTDSVSTETTTTPLYGETRASCIECVEKHIGAAMVLLSETKNGYPHYLLAVGHLHEAEEEAQTWQEVAKAIHAARKNLQVDGTIPNLTDLAELLKSATLNPATTA